MFPLSFNLTLFEIIILQIGAIVLGITIYFFWTSNKALSATLRQSKSKLKIAPKKPLLERVGLNIITLDDLQQKVSNLKNKPEPEVVVKKQASQHAVQEGLDKGAVTSLKDALQRQQQTLSCLRCPSQTLFAALFRIAIQPDYLALFLHEPIFLIQNLLHPHWKLSQARWPIYLRIVKRVLRYLHPYTEQQ